MPRTRAVVGVVLGVHLAWLGIFFAIGHEPRDLIRIGKRYVTKSTVSETIRVDPDYDYDTSRDDSKRFAGSGYDGQFSYFMALDPKGARHYMDLPAYRYQRPLYPAAAWLLSGGIDDLLPIALLLVNLIAVGAGTAVLARYLRRNGASPWWAAAYGIAPGMLIAVQRDLTEPLAWSLAAGGVIALEAVGRRRVVVAGLLFGLAALARQTTLVVPLVWGVWELVRSDAPMAGRVRNAAVVLGLGALPYVAWTLLIRSWIDGTATGEPADPVPFGWLFARAWEPARQPPVVLFALVPAFTWTGLAVAALVRGARRPVWVALALSVLLFLVIAPAYNAYTSVGRIILGTVLMTVLAVPYLDDLSRRQRHIGVAAAALWACMIPVVLVYGLTTFSV